MEFEFDVNVCVLKCMEIIEIKTQSINLKSGVSEPERSALITFERQDDNAIVVVFTKEAGLALSQALAEFFSE